MLPKLMFKYLPHSLKVSKVIASVVISFIILAVTGISIYVDYDFSTPVFITFTVIEVYNAFLLFVTLFRLIFVDPGYVPLNSQNLYTQEQNGQNDKFCQICHQNKQYKTHHCKICNRCVECYDHHCGVFNCCMSKNTMGEFLKFMLFASIQTIMSGILCIILDITHYNDYGLIRMLLIGFMAVYCIAFGLAFISQMLGMTYYPIFRGVGQVEVLNGDKGHFDMKNAKNFMGNLWGLKILVPFLWMTNYEDSNATQGNV